MKIFVRHNPTLREKKCNNKEMRIKIKMIVRKNMKITEKIKQYTTALDLFCYILLVAIMISS